MAFTVEDFEDLRDAAELAEQRGVLTEVEDVVERDPMAD